ncbi:MAG: hypothetical protein WBA42_07145 [Mesorhizobium sp.]
MADSMMERVLKALFAAIEAAKPAGAGVQRNGILPTRIPSAGMIVVRDGDPGEPEVLLSPPLYYYEHVAEVEIIVDRPAATRDAVFDALKRAVGAAIALDRTLGGLCDYVVGDSPASIMLPVDGGEGMKAATINVVLMYGSPDPLL